MSHRATGDHTPAQSQELQAGSMGDAGLSSASGLRGRWLLLATATWLFLFVAILVQFIILLPSYIPSVEHLCPQDCFFSSETARVFASRGVTVAAFAWTTLVFYVILVLVSSVLAGILFWRRSHEWMVLLVAYFLVAYPLGNLAVAIFDPFPAPITVILVTIPDITAFYAVFLLFPTGRFVPGWSWVLLALWVVSITSGSIWPNLPYALAYPICYGGAIGCQIHRYRRVSTPVQRQQTKWVVFGFVASLLANQAFWLLPFAIGQFYRPILYVVYLLLLLFVPFTFFIAVQRYRLYDIDVIINRTLVYGSLSAILAAIYIGGILGIQGLLALLTRQSEQAQSPLAIVVSTLVIAALFQPLRHRLQQLIDRRFYRSKYDAQKALAAFAATVQSEVELAALQQKLVDIIEETMQPSSISLWLRSAPPHPPSGASPAPTSTRGSL
ncbi:MAG: hypothetical protein ACLQUY_15940 [Ktedonobacterales bacterium]